MVPGLGSSLMVASVFRRTLIVRLIFDISQTRDRRYEGQPDRALEEISAGGCRSRRRPNFLLRGLLWPADAERASGGTAPEYLVKCPDVGERGSTCLGRPSDR